MKPYSVDLRQKIVPTYLNETIIQRQLAQRFHVALSFVIKILKQYRETGCLSPRKSPGRPRKLNQEQLKVLEVLVEEKNDWTLEEDGRELEKRRGVQVSHTTIDRMTKQLELTVKKIVNPDREGKRASASVKGRPQETIDKRKENGSISDRAKNLQH